MTTDEPRDDQADAPDPRLRRMADAIEATLLFYDRWTAENAARWKQITGRTEASTRTLCDFLREVRAEVTG
jgi:hypothetical protein